MTAIPDDVTHSWPEPFGFEVSYDDGSMARTYGWEVHVGWTVELPHQCGPWRIDEYREGYPPSEQAVALAALDGFIAEAQQARAALAAGREYPTKEQQL